MSAGRRKGGLAAVIDMLERELIEAPEAEIAAVLQELGLRPRMAGSVALFELLRWEPPDEDAVAEEPEEAPVLPLVVMREFRRPS